MKSLHIRRMFAKLQAVMEKTLNVLRNFHKTGRDGARPSRRRRIQPVFDNGGTTSVSSAEVLQEATLPVFWPSAFSLNPFSLGVPKGRHGRRGIALLVVIGLTAMMMLLGAAFIIYMRTERLASGNFKSDVRARQLLHVALASAMDNVEKSFVDAANPPYPPFDVLYSPIVSGGTNVVAPLSSWDLTNTCWGATNYLPRGAFVTQSWDIVNGSSAKNPSKVGWQTIKDVGGVSGEDVRYAYVVLNVSGLFDANQVGLNEGRGAGTDVQEIDLRNLPDAANVTNGFDTLPTLFAATGATNNFVVFQPYLRTNQSPLIRLDGSVGELEARNGDIIGELKKCGINNDTESVFKSLLDYVGTEVKPRDFTIPCMKKVPMLNEAKLSVAYWYDDWSVAGQTSLVCSVQAMVESWYPYATKREDGKKFKITADVQTTLKEGASVLSSSPIKIFSELAGFDPGANSFHSLDTTAIGDGMGVQMSVDCAGLYNKFVRVETKLIMHITDAGGTTTVDEAPSPANSMSEGFVIPDPNMEIFGFDEEVKIGDPIFPDVIYAIECYDPRCNWMSSFGDQWFLYNYVSGGKPGSIGRINDKTIEYIASPDNYLNDGDTNMYVSNRGYMQSVGELTYLMRSGKPTAAASPPDLWTTIRLVPPPGNKNLIDPIFDHFTIGAKRANAATPTDPAKDWGLVNANSRNHDIWEAVFTKMPLKRPGHDVGSELVTDPALLASAWLNTNNNPLVGTMTNITDFCRAGWEGYDFYYAPGFTNSVPSTLSSPLEKESFFINTAGLLGVRQNSFVILLCGEPVRAIYQGNDLTQAIVSPLSGIRAVATVWRDPVAPVGEPHRWFVRSFDILKNE